MSSIKYPNPCVRCGLCCIAETCPIGQKIYNVHKYDPCPGLGWDGNLAICKLVNENTKEVVGVGAGCCIKARAYKNGIEYDFASLSKEAKLLAVKEIRKKC